MDEVVDISDSAKKSPPKSSAQQNGGNNNDDNSTDTIMHDNSSALLHNSNFFLLVRATVPPAKKATETMREKFQKILSILRDADNDVAITPYKTDTTLSDDKVTTSPSAAITTTDRIPQSITALSKYFFGARPRSTGGTIWAQIRIVHNSNIDNIVTDTQQEMKENGCHLTIQTIQHWDVAHLGFLKNLHWDIDVDALADYINRALKRLSRRDDVVVGLKVKTPYDGKKKTSTTSNRPAFRDRIQAIHVDTMAGHREIVSKHLKAIFNSHSFKSRYAVPVRLIPLIDRRDSPYTQDKIRRCIVQHGQFCKCTDSMPCLGIKHLDQKNTTIKKTLREMIVALPDAHFLNIDLNWRKDAYSILYPRKYEEVARDRIANLGAYLHKAYGDAVLSSLPSEMQELIHSTVWDDTTGRPISKLDQELDSILDADDALEFVDLTILKELEPPAATPPPISSRFVPKVDDATVSTFGTIKDTPQSGKVNQDIALASETITTFSEVTIESRVSKMESSFTNMELLLRTILQNQTSGQGPAGSRTVDATTAGGTMSHPAAPA